MDILNFISVKMEYFNYGILFLIMNHVIFIVNIIIIHLYSIMVELPLLEFIYSFTNFTIHFRGSFVVIH